MHRLPLNRIAFVAALAAVSLAPAVLARNQAQDNMPAHMTMTADGPVLATPAGMTLYLNSEENSRADKFAWHCTAKPPTIMNDAQSGIGERPAIGYQFLKSCVDKFPPYMAGANAQAVGDFSIVQRPDGGKQWAYRGFPLYTAIKDHRPGDHNAAAGGGFGAGGRFGGMRLAWEALDLPAGLKFTAVGESLVLATTDEGRLVYTPAAGARLLPASAGGLEFRPLSAGAMSSVKGDWSIIESGLGHRQYAFRGKPLYAVPSGMNEDEIAAIGGWDPVVVYKGPVLPAAIGKHLTLLGDVYTDKKGMTLYTYNCNANGGGGGPRLTSVACDDAGDPAAFMVALCGDGKECARRWHPYLAPADAKPQGLWSVVDITYPMFTDPHGPLYPAGAPKAKAWAYRGQPVFTFYVDEKPGDIWGDRTGGIWGSSFAALMVPGRTAFYD